MKKNSMIAAAMPIALLGVMLAAGSVSADTAKHIRILCVRNWPENLDEQRLCRERQSTAADELFNRIEAASESSLEFSIARTCVERSKVTPPFTIDWMQALMCFKNRLSGTLRAEDP